MSDVLEEVLAGLLMGAVGGLVWMANLGVVLQHKPQWMRWFYWPWTVLCLAATIWAGLRWRP